MTGWEATTLAELCEAGGLIQTGPFGSQLHMSDYTATGVPVIMPTNIGDGRVDSSGIMRTSTEKAQTLARHMVKPGDIVYSRRGDITKRALIRGTEEGWLCGTGCLLVRPAERVNRRWLSYWLAQPEIHRWLVNHAVGATMLNLNTKILGQVPVLRTPRAEQERIASVLGCFDDLIETNRHTQRTIEDLLHAVFAKEQFDTHPNGETVLVGDIVEINPRIAKPKGVVPYVGMSMLPTDSALLTRTAERQAAGGAKFSNGDTLLARITPCLENGKTAYITDLPDSAVAVGSTEFIVLRGHGPTKGIWPYFLARSPRFRAFVIQQLGDGTSGRQRVSADVVANYRLPAPSAAALERFCRIANPLTDALTALHGEAQDVARWRDELLPLLMSGRVRVRDLEGAAYL